MAARSAALGSALISALAVLAGPAPIASAEPCSDVELLFARGTSEPPGIGRVGQALADSLRPQLGGRTLSTYGINYPATYDFLAALGATVTIERGGASASAVELPIVPVDQAAVAASASGAR